jgi:hypothetical protein
MVSTILMQPLLNELCLNMCIAMRHSSVKMCVFGLFTLMAIIYNILHLSLYLNQWSNLMKVIRTYINIHASVHTKIISNLQLNHDINSINTHNKFMFLCV